MDNTDPNDLGIIRFGFDLFPNTLDQKYGVADWVRPTLYNMLKYHDGMDKIDRCWAVCTSRDYSKSTWIAKILPLYLMLVGQYGIYFDGKHLLPEADYIRLRAKNQEKAEEKLGNVAMEFFNERVIQFFGDLRPSFQEVRDRKLKNTSKLIILRNNYIFQAQGLNMPSRGANIKDRRPKVDIDDDVENKENTKTDTMRGYNAKEILGEQFGGLSQDGLTIYIGNFVHQECIMAKLQMEDSGWNQLFFQASSFDEKGVEVSGWAKRYSMKYLNRLGEWYRKQPALGGYKIFRMEYYNEIISDKDYVINWIDGRYIRKDGMNFVEYEEFGQRKMVRIHIIVSGDPAISQRSGSSDGAVSVVGFGIDDRMKKRFVLHVSLAKFDIVDRYTDQTKKPHILAITPEEMGNVKRKGLVSEMGRLIVRFHADGFVVENAGQQLAWYNDLKEDILRPLGISIPGLPYHPVDEKVYKLEVGLMNQISAGRYYLVKKGGHIKSGELQINTFPDNKLDILDTWFNAEQLGKFPAPITQRVGSVYVDYDPAKAYEKRQKEMAKKGAEEWVFMG
jgi:hypothetical protein